MRKQMYTSHESDSFTHNSKHEMQLSTYLLKSFVEHTPANSQYLNPHKWKFQSVNIHIKAKNN